MQPIDAVLKIIGIPKLQQFFKNYVNQLIDTRVKEVLINEKIDNIIHQLTLEDVKYLETIKNSSCSINFADHKFIKLKMLGLVNESIDYKASNDNLKKMQISELSTQNILIAYLTFADYCDDICYIINGVKNKQVDGNNIEANDLTKARNTAIKKFSKQ